jgi:hypothetical protein
MNHYEMICQTQITSLGLPLLSFEVNRCEMRGLLPTKIPPLVFMVLLEFRETVHLEIILPLPIIIYTLVGPLNKSISCQLLVG